MPFDGPVGPARLTVACLDCARFDARDFPVAWLAAVASSAPYAMVLGLAAATYATASPVAATALAAGFANEAASLALKKFLARPRPAARCRALGTCGDAGMPSSHAQNVGYAWAVHTGLARAGLVGVGGGGRGGSGRASLPAWWAGVESAALAAAAAIIVWARVYLGYHTWTQVAAGGGLGLAVGLATARAIRAAVAGGRLGGGRGRRRAKQAPSPMRTASPARRGGKGAASPPASPPHPRWRR